MKRLIKSYRSLTHVRIGDDYIRKDAIRVVEDKLDGTIYLWAGYGAAWTLTGKEAKRVIAELCFNEK